jgi:hypothetical protein
VIFKLLETQAMSPFCDNQSVIQLTKNLVFHAMIKHVEVHHHYIKEEVQNKEMLGSKENKMAINRWC